mmetsp:Transcript_12069/g.17488  ORF Transcript_12069/g.17488 Transcript_12069/m.17488 type:complete len:215 (+) Transcript_12069:58-702(+)|eukprot:CAMPEP_0195520164 /NCGR_PEP_ID=MMETSP0794_2-20130614/16300_1 /TAXON_ID=515487 /ORGANISM="Stephanopyxis turris, Strain CCMP 815" /LENGTH=214 /DNA_ID=CAMNT_0040649461 /DNA_START=56 /DNA_END=700 /DNA_ORIENTATION=+
MSRRRYQKKADVASNTARETSRALQKEQRGMDRERRKLEAEEKKIIAKIKDCHKKNDLASAKIYARDLLRVRASAKRMLVMKSRIGSIAHRTKHMASTLKMTTAIQTASSAMSRINAAIDPQRFSAMMQQFAQQNDRMNVTEEMMDDMMDDFDQADEAEVDEITSSVLAEIGIELESKLPAAKSGSMPALPQQQPQSLKTGDQATDALLAELGI